MPQTIDRPRRRDSGLNHGGRWVAVVNPEDTVTNLLPPRSDTDRAADPATDPGDLIELSFSRNPTVRQAIASNPSTPADVLQRYLEGNYTLRSAIITNPNLREKSIEYVLDHPRAAGDLQALARRQHLAANHVARLLRGGVLGATAAAQRSDLTRELVDPVLPTAHYQVALAIAENASMPADVQRRAKERADEHLAEIRSRVD